MPDTDRAIYADPAAERLWTGATVITFARTLVSLALCLLAALDESRTLLIVGLGVYWVGDMADGAYARLFDCETRIGGVIDMLCDRINCAAFYIGLAWLQPDLLLPISVYLFEFMVIDMFLSLAFLAWPIRSPNYFYAVDRRIYLWNWSKPAKAVNSSLFAVLLLVLGQWNVDVAVAVGLAIALSLVALKVVSLRWLLQLGLPVPERVSA